MITPHPHSPTLLKPVKLVGIVGYGAYVPRYRLPAKEVARVWTGGVVSFGSGAGSDAFDILVTDKVTGRAGLAMKTQEYIARRTEIDYATYTRYRGKIQMK